jgi:hypothetical protein
MPRLFSLPLTVFWMGLATQACASGDCGWSPDKRIDYRPGENQFFKYDSRVEKSDSTADTYIWCIENKDRYSVLDFRWGNQINDKLYYFGLIEPQKSAPTTNSFSGGYTAQIRVIKFKRTFEDDRSWRAFDIETIFPAILGRGERPFGFGALIPTSDVKLAQVSPSIRDPLDAFRDPTGLIDIERLSANRELLDQYLRFNDVSHHMSTVATIPTNLRALELLSSAKYEKYDPEDFVRMKVELNNGLKDGPSSFAVYRIGPEDKSIEGLRRSSAAISQVQLFSELIPIGRALTLLPKEATIRQDLKDNQGEWKSIFVQKANRLVYVDAIFRIGSRKSDMIFSQVPVRILVALQGT